MPIAAVQGGALPIAEKLRTHDGLKNAEFVLELGRWIAGPSGALLTSVLTTKESRGQRTLSVMPVSTTTLPHVV